MRPGTLHFSHVRVMLTLLVQDHTARGDPRGANPSHPPPLPTLSLAAPAHQAPSCLGTSCSSPAVPWSHTPLHSGLCLSVASAGPSLASPHEQLLNLPPSLGPLPTLTSPSPTLCIFFFAHFTS